MDLRIIAAKKPLASPFVDPATPKMLALLTLVVGTLFLTDGTVSLTLPREDVGTPQPSLNLNSLNTSLGSSFKDQDEPPDLRLVPSDWPGDYHPAWAITHMYMSNVRKAWMKAPPEKFTTWRGSDSKVPGSESEIKITPGLGYNTQLIGWCSIIALKLQLSISQQSAREWVVPTWDIEDGETPRKIGEYHSTIRPQLSSTDINSTSINNRQPPVDILRTKRQAPAATPSNITSLDDTGPSIVVWVIPKGEPIFVTPILHLLASALDTAPWPNPNYAPIMLSQKARTGFRIGPDEGGRILRIAFLEVIQQGQAIYWQDVERAISDIVLNHWVRNEPQTFEANAYLLDGRGHKFQHPFLRVNLEVEGPASNGPREDDGIEEVQVKGSELFGMKMEANITMPGAVR